MSYRFRRRAFLQGLGGAFGLKIMLRNLEASAQGMKPPPRLLIAHWPLGTVRPDFIPTNGNIGSPILKPFGDAGLAGDVTALLGLSTAAMPSGGGGGAEAGTVKLMTGVAPPGTRGGEVEGDDAYAGGPSFDQIFLANAPMLQRPGAGYANSICDARVDVGELSTRCLSYGYDKQPVSALSGASPAAENVPNVPVLSPLAQWINLFGGFVPGGTDTKPEAMLKALRSRKSVLDLSLRQLARLATLAPASERPKIDAHAAAIRAVETQLATQIQRATPSVCATKPSAPPATVVGKEGSHIDYGMPVAPAPDDPTHAAVGQLHMDILKAAFICDLIRVATFQWSPGTNHVAFQGLYPGDPVTSYMHNPLSKRVLTADTLVTGPNRNPVVGFLSNVHAWYNARMAEILAGWKTTTDGMGGNLLDSTIVPFVTERAGAGSEHDNLPALLIGGAALGFQHGQYVSLTGRRSINDLWLTVAQAFGLSATFGLANEQFVAEGHFTGPIDGLWAPPA